MQLSERGAINAAIADGGFHLYPAGHLLSLVSSEFAGDSLRSDFVPEATAEKIARLHGPTGAAAQEIFRKDIALLCKRLAAMPAQYDIEAVFDRMMEASPGLARRYYGLEDFHAPRPRVVEYYFEGHTDAYRDGDWFAFNVNRAESREMGVPVGIYFKRDQVSPGLPEFAALHEANHAMQEAAYLSGDLHYYIPWMDEGFADAFGRMMLFRATGDETLLAKIKHFRTEIEVTDPRKVTYHYGAETASMLLLRGRLPFVKALFKARGRDPFSFDWNLLACRIKEGWDPHIAVVNAYRGEKQDAFRKRFERDEAAFRKEADLDQSDLRILQMFLATQPPACLPPDHYAAALWLADEVARRPCPYAVDPHAIPAAMRPELPHWDASAPIPWTEIPEAVRRKAPEIDIKILIREGDIPEALRPAVAALAAKYFILKRQFGDATVFEPYGGGLPYRLGTGEIRCGCELSL